MVQRISPSARGICTAYRSRLNWQPKNINAEQRESFRVFSPGLFTEAEEEEKDKSGDGHCPPEQVDTSQE